MKKQKLKEQIKKCRQGIILWKYCDFHNNKSFVENSDKNVVGFFFTPSKFSLSAYLYLY